MHNSKAHTVLYVNAIANNIPVATWALNKCPPSAYTISRVTYGHSGIEVATTTSSDEKLIAQGFEVGSAGGGKSEVETLGNVGNSNVQFSHRETGQAPYQ